MLKPHEDAYGQMIWDQFHGKRPVEIVERDDGRIDTSGGPPSYFSEFKDWPAHQRRAMKFVRGRVLDVGCGAGRCCLYLQQRGHQVIGIDVSPLAIKTCRARGVKDARVLPFTQVNRRFGTFDTILMMGNNFGLFASRDRARWLLRRLHGLTSPQARIVAETLDVHQTDNPDHLSYTRWNCRRGRMPGQIRLRVRYGNLRTPWFDYLMVSKRELAELLRGTGWQVERHLDSQGPQYVAVITKGDS